MEYEIVKKAQFTVVGISRKFNADTAYVEIPKFWQEVLNSETGEALCGTYGICVENGGDKEFSYYIADDYVPWTEFPDNLEIKVIPACTWAVFACKGALPEAIQSVNTKIWNEWLPSHKEYRVAANFNIELYTPPCENPQDDYSEIWVPIENA